MCILSLVLGLACGLLTIIPLIGGLAFLALILAASIAVLLYMRKNNLIGILEVKQAAMYGAIIGFVVFIGFAVTMIPIAGIMGWLNALWFHKLVWFTIVRLLFTMGFTGIFMMVMLVFFTALLSALMNSFTAMVAVSFLQELDGSNKNKDDLKIDIEIK